MGNCCKITEKEKEVIKLPAEPGTMVTEDRSQRKKTLQILCEDPDINLNLQYRPAIPIQDIKEQILAEYPNLDMTKYSLFRDDLEILDATATLQQLGIVQGDILTLKKSISLDYSEDIIASENNSISEPKEEITNKEIAGITAKKGLAARNVRESELCSPKKPAQEL